MIIDPQKRLTTKIETFLVYWRDATGYQHKEVIAQECGDFIERHTLEQTKNAMLRLTKGPAAIGGMIKEVQVVDQDDYTCFLWREGEVIFPSKEEIQNTANTKE